MKITFTLLAALLFLCGCRSAEDDFKDGQTAESDGDNLRAIRYYIEALKKNPQYLESKERLENVGKRQLLKYIGLAKVDISQGRGFESLNQLKRAKSLHQQLVPYTSDVTLPKEFTALHKQGQQAAIRSLFRSSQQAERNTKWDAALGYLNDIQQYEPNSEQRLRLLKSRTSIKNIAFNQQIELGDKYFNQKNWAAALESLVTAKKYADDLSKEKMINERNDKFRNGLIIQEATGLKKELDTKNWLAAEERMKRLDSLQNSLDKSQLDAIRLLKARLYNTWADDLFNQKKYRHSWAKSAEVLKFDGENKSAIDRQHQARKLGTVAFTILPFIHSKKAKNLVFEMNSSFNNGPARDMPPFTILTTNFDLQEAIRVHRVDPQRISRDQAAAIGRRNRAAFVVFREVTNYRFEQEFTASRNETVARNTQPPSNTTLEIKKGNLILKASIRFSVIDSQTGHSVFSEEAIIDSVLEFEQAFAGEPVKNLKLNQKQFSLLEAPGNAKDFQHLEKTSSAKGTAFFSEKVLPQLESLVP